MDTCKNASVVGNWQNLPPEIWKSIFLKLTSSPNELLKCRRVSNSWKSFAGEVLQDANSMWKPIFDFDFQGFHKKLIGTRFSTPAEVLAFIAEMDGVTTNPFPNGTVIFVPRSQLNSEEKKEFYATFYKLVDSFQDSILNLVYYFNDSDDDMEFFLQFWHILKLQNLKSLAVFKSNWKFLKTSKVPFLLKDLLKSTNFPVTRKLAELQIFYHYGHFLLFYVFAVIEPFLQSLSSIRFMFQADADTKYGLDGAHENFHFGKLQNLKMCMPNQALFQHFCLSASNTLKQVSFRFSLAHRLPISMNMGQALNGLDVIAKSLELLHLDVVTDLSGTPPPASLPLIHMPELDPLVKYYKLKMLILRFCIIRQWPTLISQLKGKFVNLRELKLLLYPSDTAECSPKVFYKRVDGLWKLFPNSLEVIKVPHFAWEIRRGQSLMFE